MSTLAEPDVPDGQIQLHRGRLSLFEVLAQSVANLGPSAVVGALFVLVFAASGAGSWLIWIIATAVLVCVGATISYLAKRFNTTGGVYPLMARALKPGAGYAIAWAEALSIVAGAPAVMFQGAVFLGAFLALPAFGLPNGRWTALIIAFIFSFVPALLAYYDVKLSARVMLTLESISMSLITILMIVVLATHRGGIFDSHELRLQGLSLHTILLGGSLTVFAFAGFESAAVYGREARKPNRAIPTSVLASVIICGLFFIFCSYVIFLGYDHSRSSLATTPNPLEGVARIAGVTWLGYIVDVGVIIGIFSVMIAIFSGGSRFFYTLGREGALPKVLGTVSRRRHTPIGGILFMGLCCFVPLGIVIGINASVFNAYGNFGTLSGYGAATMYLGTGLFVAVLVVWRLRLRRLDLVVAGLIGGAALGYGLYIPFNPFLPFPGSVWLLVYCGVVAAGAVSYLWLRWRRPFLLRRVGSSAAAAETTVEAGGPQPLQPTSTGVAGASAPRWR